MFRFSAALLILVLFWQPSWAAKISLASLDELEDVAVYDRLDRILQRQKETLFYCRDVESGLDNFLDNDVRPTPRAFQKKEILDLIHAVRTTRQLISTYPKCAGRSLVPSVRKPLLIPAVHGNQATSFWTDLAPACFPVAGKGAFREKENNACFAADGMIFRDLKSFQLSVPENTLLLSQALYLRLLKTPLKGSLDLFAVYTDTFPGRGPREMWTLLAAFTTSGNSGLTGWLQGVEDQVLVSDLNDLTLSDAQVYQRFKQLQLAKITYQKFRDLADRFYVSLTVFGSDIYSWNRHNFMAAYLGCRDSGTLAQVVRRVYAVGVGYESKDFVFHLLEGVKLRPSIENFEVDTARYKQSSYIGWQTCH